MFQSHIVARSVNLQDTGTFEDLDRVIHRAVAFVGLMPKEDRYRPF